jgi:hypothetical protein
MSALILGPEQKQALADLKAKAEASPLHMPSVHFRLNQPGGLDQHQADMEAYTIQIPATYTVSFTIDDDVNEGHKARHLSMSTATPGKVPHMQALVMVAKELGFNFTGEDQSVLTEGAMWLEDVGNGQKAVNMIQYL